MDNVHKKEKKILKNNSEPLTLPIKTYIIHNNLSRQQFAQITGVSISTIDKLLAGNIRFSEKMRHRIHVKTGIEII
jgi:transcriptional regulator with XRE-family HTH domain